MEIYVLYIFWFLLGLKVDFEEREEKGRNIYW